MDVVGPFLPDKRPLAQRQLGKIVAEQASALGDRPFVWVDGVWTSYAEANRRANRVANWVAGLGIEKGARVGVLLNNRIEYLDLWFGLAKMGALELPISIEYRWPQLVQLLERAPIDLLVFEASFAAELAAAFAKTTVPRPRLAVVDASPGELEGFEHAMDYRKAVGSAPELEPLTLDALTGADAGAILNTSGTTGVPKGVVVPYAQHYIFARNLVSYLGLASEDVSYNFFHFFHNSAQVLVTYPTLLSGGRMILTKKFSVSGFWPDVLKHGCTTFCFMAEMLRLLLRGTYAEDAKGSRLRVAWGYTASASDWVEFESRYGVSLRSGWGNTESNASTYVPLGSKKPGSAGRAIPGFELRIANELGEPLPAGATGEILVRSSEPYAVMLGYDANPEATVEAFRDLWLCTGDTGYLDDDGDLTFMGRVKDSLRVRGENISALEVEEAIERCKGVQEVAAIAVPSELGGDELKVVVVREKGSTLTPEALISHAEALLPRYSVPRYVEFVCELPKTLATGKVQKALLRGNPVSANTWDRVEHLGRTRRDGAGIQQDSKDGKGS